MTKNSGNIFSLSWVKILSSGESKNPFRLKPVDAKSFENALPQPPFQDNRNLDYFLKFSEPLTAVTAVVAEILIAVSLLKLSSFDMARRNS